MRHTMSAAVLLATAGLALTACSGSSHTDKPAATTTPATVTATTASGTVKLSTRWVPKLNALSGGSGISACSTDSGSDGCVTAIGDAVSLYGSITNAITAANAQAEYPKTIAELTKLIGAADTYDKDECPGDSNADVDGSPCPKNAIDAVNGLNTLEFIMQTDELNAGVK